MVEMKTLDDGTVEWRTNGLLHRPEIEGPTIIRPTGTVEYYLHGVLHREGGPAIKYFDGSEEWRLRNKLHRLNAPALTLYESFHGAPGWKLVELWERGVFKESRWEIISQDE